MKKIVLTCVRATGSMSALAAIGMALLCLSTASVGTEMDDINARIRARNAELKGQAPQKVKIDASPVAEDQARAQIRLQNDRRRYLDENQPSQGGQITSLPMAPVADPDNEKVLIHERTGGWDRKTRKQIAAEEAAKAEGRERARLAAQQPGTIVLDSKGRTYTTIGGGLAIPTDGRSGGVPCPVSDRLVVCP
jgi:hypothetical protein